MSDRTYVKRAGLTYLDTFISMSLYHTPRGTDAEGIWGDQPFDTLNDLITKASWTPEQTGEFIKRLETLLNA